MRRLIDWLWRKLVGAPLQGHPEDEDAPTPVDPVEAGTMSRNNPRWR
jgi:hypothetical protein